MSATPLVPLDAKISYKPAPKPPGPELWVLRLDTNQEIKVTVIGSEVKGVETHWVNGKTQPHYEDETVCPGCLKRIRVDWKGYLHCYWWEKSKQIFLELTPGSYHALQSQIKDGAPLRGSVIKVKRKGARNQPLMIAIDGHSRREHNIPEEKDPLPSILKLWGLYAAANGHEAAPQEEPTYEEPLKPPPDAF